MSARPSDLELDAIRTISAESLPSLIWREENVITTELLARLYGTESIRVRQNFAGNSSRFIEGKHFYRVIGEELRELKDRVVGNDSVKKGARSAILWTERGAARHAKMLETNEAWDVFEALEDHYFRRSDGSGDQSDAELSTVRDREPLLYAAVTMVVKHRLPFHVVYQTMNHFAGSLKFAVMTKAQVSEVAQFVERFLIGNDTRQDWARIEMNRKEIAGESPQPELLGFVVPGTMGGIGHLR